MSGEETDPQSPGAKHIEVSGGIPPPEEVAEGLGGVALDEESLHNQTLRVDDKDIAREMADASDEQWTLAANLEQSGIPGAADFAKTLREKGDELAEQAKADYEKEKVNYEEARDYIIGRIVALAKGEIKTTDPLIIMGSQLRRAEDWVNVGNTTIKSPQAEELRNLVYKVLGAEKPPDEEAFRHEGTSNWWTAETPSKIGVNISETRHRYSERGDDYKEIVEEGLGDFVSLSIARSQEKAEAQPKV